MPSASFASFPFAGAPFAPFSISFAIILGSQQPLVFYMVQSADHTTPATNLSPQAWISQNGGWFAPSVGGVYEIGEGWYGINSNLSDVSMIGPLLIDVPAVGGADPVSVRYEVLSAAGICPVTVGSTRYPLTFLMVQSSDHISAATGLSPTVLIRKVGQSFTNPVGSIVEIGADGVGGGTGRGRGWYKLLPLAVNFDTPGPMLLHATASGTDDTDQKWDVVGTSVIGLIDNLTLSLLAVKSTLVNAGIGFTNNSCIVSLDSEPFTNPSPPCAWVTPGSFTIDDALQTGGGRYSILGNNMVTIRVIVRRMSDTEASDLSWLTNPARGGYPIIFAIINALAETFLFDISGNPLTTIGIKPERIMEPYRYRGDKMMAVVPIVCSYHVLLDLQVPQPS